METSADKNKILLTVPLNWEDNYFDELDFSNIEEVYGKMKIDFIGGGRPPFTMKDVSRRKVESFVHQAHRRNVKFNYLLNATCLDNIEISKKGYATIRSFLDWLAKINVDVITVSIPFLAEIIKKNYPQIEVSVSVQSRIDCFEKAKYWENLGADKLNISYVDLNKNFEEIRKIRQHTSCRLQTIANLMCCNRCPYVTIHGNYNAHASQKNHVLGNFCLDYYILWCSEMIFQKPVEILKSAIIRPEDLHYYEKAGLNSIKLVERGMTTPALKRIVKAYTERSYEGSLMDLFPSSDKSIFYKNKLFLSKQLGFLFRLSMINVFKMRKYFSKFNKPDTKSFRKNFDIFIDNRKLDGFLDFFYQGKCERDCTKCNHCDEYAEKAVSLVTTDEIHKRNVQIFSDIRNGMICGDVYN